MTQIINGKEIAQDLRNNLKKEIVELKKKYGNIPGLAVVQVGNVVASSVYVKAKAKNAKEVGIKVIDYHLEESIKQKQLLEIINTSNRFVYTAMEFLYRLCEPSLRLVRKYVPNLGNIDISPIIVFLLLWFLQSLLIEYWPR